jgi:hypothetical protein
LASAGEGVSADDISFAHKMENENIEQRLAILFAKEDSDLQGEDKVINDNLQDPYLSVNEDLTTDTSATTDYEDSSVGQRGSV